MHEVVQSLCRLRDSAACRLLVLIDCVVSGNVPDFGPIWKLDDTGRLHRIRLERAGSTDELHVSNMNHLSVVFC